MKKEYLYIIIGFLVAIIIFLGASISTGQKTSHEDMTMSDMVSALEGKKGDEFDKAFIEHMIPHHQGAVEMAQLALENAEHQELKNLAKAIIEAQNTEINQMHNWFESWGYGEHNH